MNHATLSLDRRTLLALILMLLLAGELFAQKKLSSTEQGIRTWIHNNRENQIEHLAQAVNIPSGTLNLPGVRRMAEFYRATLDSLGFTTRWIPMESVKRSGHLIAEHKGKPGMKTILLLGHLDTVFEREGPGWLRQDSVGRGPGSNDMKGGNAVLLYALKALAHAGVLRDANVIVFFTGDEESVGRPLDVARRDMVEAAKRSNVALSFEGGSMRNATVARRGASGWRLEVTAQQGHSSGIFRPSAGYGAIYEAARIVNEFRLRLSGVPYLTFNPGIIAGGTDVEIDSSGTIAHAEGKSNIIAPRAYVSGDLRFITNAQLDSVRQVMRDIVAASLPGTKATITFQDGYPAMAPAEAHYRLLEQYSEASEALGYGPVLPLDPGQRGAGDIAFIADLVPQALDGLGVSGTGAHSPDERVFLNSLPMQTERAAVLIYRLSRQPSTRTKAN
jgi:glutamate carboxypeptidase